MTERGPDGRAPLRWDDLRLFLAVARSGSARAAGTELGLSHSTVARRIEECEARLGATLFDRIASGYAITATGERLVGHAESMERTALAAERLVAGEDDRLEGDVRVTLPLSLACGPLMDDLVGFARAYPRIDLELETSDALLDIARREADIAIRFQRLGEAPPEHLIGRHVGVSCNAAYASAAYLRGHALDAGSGARGADDDRPGAGTDGRGDEPAPPEARWLGWGEGVRRPPWIGATALPELLSRHRFDDPMLQLHAARAGAGLALIPCMLGDADPALVRVPGTAPMALFDIWILSHPGLRDMARLRAMRDWLVAALEAKAPALRGVADAALLPHGHGPGGA